MNKKELFFAKEALSLALFQLSDYKKKYEDVEFAYQNIESVLEIICDLDKSKT